MLEIFFIHWSKFFHLSTSKYCIYSNLQHFSYVSFKIINFPFFLFIFQIRWAKSCIAILFQMINNINFGIDNDEKKTEMRKIELVFLASAYIVDLWMNCERSRKKKHIHIVTKKECECKSVELNYSFCKTNNHLSWK